MDFKDQPFIPMLFGGDINTYSVARAFYEEYQVKTYVFGKFPSGPSYNSNIIEYHADLKIDTDDVFMKTVRDFAAAHADKTVLTIGCGDSYVALCSRHKDEMPKNVVATKRIVLPSLPGTRYRFSGYSCIPLWNGSGF